MDPTSASGLACFSIFWVFLALSSVVGFCNVVVNSGIWTCFYYDGPNAFNIISNKSLYKIYYLDIIIFYLGVIWHSDAFSVYLYLLSHTVFIFLTLLIDMRISLSVRSKHHFTGPRWSYSAICENASQKILTTFFIKMCIFFTKNILQFCKMAKIRIKSI